MGNRVDHIARGNTVWSYPANPVPPADQGKGTWEDTLETAYNRQGSIRARRSERSSKASRTPPLSSMTARGGHNTLRRGILRGIKTRFPPFGLCNQPPPSFPKGPSRIYNSIADSTNGSRISSELPNTLMVESTTTWKTCQPRDFRR